MPAICFLIFFTVIQWYMIVLTLNYVQQRKKLADRPDFDGVGKSLDQGAKRDQERLNIPIKVSQIPYRYPRQTPPARIGR